MAVMPYEGLYVGLPVLFNPSGRWLGRNHTGLNQTELSVSRDLRHWDRVANRDVFIGVLPWDGEVYDTSQMLPCGRPVVREDLGEIWVYYNACRFRCHRKERDESYAKYFEDLSALCLAKIRLDGFVSLDADAKGTLVTAPFALDRGGLYVNVDADRGELRAEVVDAETFDAVPGLAMSDCDAVRDDDPGAAANVGRAERPRPRQAGEAALRAQPREAVRLLDGGAGLASKPPRHPKEARGMPKQVDNRRYTVAVEKDVRVPMRDGTILRADVYHPEGKGRYPTIVTRTAYNKSRIDTRYYEERGYSLAERGYTFVAQDIRGTYASEGDFFPCTFRRDHHDTEDGYDTIEWAARLPWSTGKVGTVGSSYDGWTQWELAHARPPHLAAMMPQAIAASTLDQEMSGVLRLGQSLQWFIVNLAPDQIARDDEPWGPRNWDDSRRLFNERDRDKWTWFLPLMEIPDHAMHGLGHHWRKWLGERGTGQLRLPHQAAQNRGAGLHHHLLVRPAGQRPQALQRNVRERRLRDGPRPDADHGRPVEAHRHRLRAHGRQGRLRAGGGAGLLPGRRAVVRPLAQRRGHRARRCAAGRSYSSWAPTAGGTRTSGRCPRRATPTTTSTATGMPGPSPATGCCRGKLRMKALPTSTTTTRATLS